jgi:hypothetical protein
LPAAAAGWLAAAAARDLSADLPDLRFQRLKSQIRQAKIVNPVLDGRGLKKKDPEGLRSNCSILRLQLFHIETALPQP